MSRRLLATRGRHFAAARDVAAAKGFLLRRDRSKVKGYWASRPRVRRTVARRQRRAFLFDMAAEPWDKAVYERDSSLPSSASLSLS